MHWVAPGMALLLAFAIIAIGILYLAKPLTATRSFGLPLPENGTNIVWWLRLKGARDIVSGLAVLAFMMWSEPSTVGIILLVGAIIPVGDMLLILAAKGSSKSAFGTHGLTAVLMVLAAMPLMIGIPGDGACSFNLAPCCRFLWRRPLQRDRHARDAKRFRPVRLAAVVEHFYWWTGDNERRSDCASCQSHCWPNAWGGNHCGCGFDRSTPPRFFRTLCHLVSLSP